MGAPVCFPAFHGEGYVPPSKGEGKGKWAMFDPWKGGGKEWKGCGKGACKGGFGAFKGKPMGVTKNFSMAPYIPGAGPPKGMAQKGGAPKGGGAPGLGGTPIKPSVSPAA